jgi:hypothetical protein
MKNKEVTPIEEWEKKRPTLSYLRTWGCLAKVSVPINKKHKLGPKTVDCVFLRYAFHSVRYRFLVVKSGVPDLLVGTIMESRDATFFENIFPMRDETSSSRQESVENYDSTKSMELNEPTFIEHPEEDNDEAPRRSKRQRTEKSFGDVFIIYLVDDTPKTIAEAYSSPDADYWKEAVRSEMDSIMSNGTWEVVERPYECKPVDVNGCSKRSLGRMVLLTSTRLDLWPRVTPKRKEKTSMILTSCSIDYHKSTTFRGSLSWSSRSSDGR